MNAFNTPTTTPLLSAHFTSAFNGDEHWRLAFLAAVQRRRVSGSTDILRMASTELETDLHVSDPQTKLFTRDLQIRDISLASSLAHFSNSSDLHLDFSKHTFFLRVPSSSAHLRLEAMVTSPGESEMENTIAVTIKVSRKHALDIRGAAGAGDVESTFDLISSTSRAVFKAVKSLPATALEGDKPMEAALVKPTSQSLRNSNGDDKPSAEDIIRDVIIHVTYDDSLKEKRRKLEPLTYRRPPSEQKEITFTVWSMMTIADLAKISAYSIGCPIDHQYIHYDGLVLWSPDEGTHQKVMPPDTVLDSVSKRGR